MRSPTIAAAFSLSAALLAACASAPPPPEPTPLAPAPRAPIADPLPLASASTSASSAPIDPPPPPEPPPLPLPAIDEHEPIAGWVLVWHDAKLFAAPDAASPSVALATLERPREESLGAVVALEVVRSKGDFVEVKTGKADETECGWAWIELAHDVGELHAFVRRTDLAPVLAKPIERSFDDGTRVELRPGLAALPALNGRWTLALGFDRVALDVPADAIAHAYPKRPAFDPFDWQLAVRLSARAAPSLGGGAKMTVHRGLAEPLAEGAERRGDRALFPFHYRCGKVIASVPAELVSPWSPPRSSDGAAMFGIGFGHGGTLGGERLVVPRGTPLAWGASKRAAVTTDEIDLSEPPEPGKDLCLERRLWISSSYLDRPTIHEPKPAPTILLCASRSAIKKEKWGFGSGRLGAPIRGTIAPKGGVKLDGEAPKKP